MTAQESLLPCPFCGGHPTLTKHHREDMWGLIHRCEVVGAVSFDWGAAERHAARWNRRAQPVARTPLTDDAVLDAFCNEPHQNQFVSVFKQGVRYAERAHGITQEKQG